MNTRTDSREKMGESGRAVAGSFSTNGQVYIRETEETGVLKVGEV